MKTFDRAVKYLRHFDFSKIDMYDIDLVDKQMSTEIHEKQKLFMDDNKNKVSNEHYRSIIFTACVFHLVQIDHEQKSYWNAACEIVEAERHILAEKYEGFTAGSVYPKVMMDRFNEWCDSLEPMPVFLLRQYGSREALFMAAFHYVIDEIS